MSKLHVLSYNIHKGLSTTNTQHVLGGIKRSIEMVSADLVLLQEVLGDHQEHKKNFEDWPDASQFEFLADKIWPHHAYGKNAVYTEGHHGNAILSKHPIVFYENVNISTNRFENRGLLHAVIRVPDLEQDLHVICLHLDLLESGRLRQLELLSARIDQVVPHDAPLIVGGDFNDWRERASRILYKRLGLMEAFFALTGKHARTFPAAVPIFKLDRLYSRRAGVQSASVLSGGIWSGLSDHAAICAEFDLSQTKI